LCVFNLARTKLFKKTKKVLFLGINPFIMKKIFYLLLLLSNILIYSQDIIIKEFNSDELGTTRILKIYVPESYEIEGTRLYPLSILLDGDFLFDVYTGNAKLFALKDKAPEQIIVGIMQNENKERYIDCGYETLDGLPTEESSKFYRFIQSELLEYLKLNYRISPFRTLVGNTLTANFINYFVIESEPMFDAYININPYYNKDMPIFLQNKLINTRGQMVYYYLNTGNYNSKEKHERIKQVAYVLNSLESPDVRYRYDDFKNTTKTASIAQAIPAALAHIFEIYSAISKEEFALNIKHLSPPDAIAYLENKYVEIEYLFGTNMKIRERDIYGIEPIIIDQENGDYLSLFGEMINRLYPESPLSDYYVGMFYEKAGRFKQALKNYKNGYAKIDKDSEDAEAFYANIERVLDRQDEIIQLEVLEKKEKEVEKEISKIEKEINKEEWEANKKKGKEQKEAEKKLKQQEFEEKRKAEKEMREKYRKGESG